MEHGIKSNGRIVSMSPTALATMLIAVLGAAGGGGSALSGIAHNTEMAVLSQRVATLEKTIVEVRDDLKEFKRELKQELERANGRLERLLEQDRRR